MARRDAGLIAYLRGRQRICALMQHARTARTVVVCDDVPSDPTELALVVAIAAEFGGAASRSAGGRLALAFGSADSGVAAARQIQRSLRSRGRAGRSLGVDHGTFTDGHRRGPIGLAPYVAGRLADRCRPGDIVLTDRVAEALASPLRVTDVATTTTTVPGVDGRQRIHVVTPCAIDDRRRELAHAIASPTANSAP